MKKYLLFIACLFILESKAQIPNNIPTNGLLLWLGFSGNTIDSSGNGNHATNYGASLTTDRNNKSNSAYSFNGSNNYLQVAAPSFSFADTSKFTFSIWVNKRSTSGGVAMIHATTAANNFIYMIGGASNTSYGTNKQQSAWIWANCAHSLNQWAHYVGVYNSGSMSLYKNGVLESTASYNHTGATRATLPLFIGSGINANYFEGDVDDIGIWNRALSASEIAVLYQDCDNLITQQPLSQTRTVGSNAQFYASAGNNATYQWQVNNGNGFVNVVNNTQYSGATNQGLLVRRVTFANDSTKFRCIINLASCKDTTEEVDLYVICGKLFLDHPKNATASQGASASFSVSTNFNTLSQFQWQVNLGNGYQNLSNQPNIMGADSTVLSLSDLSSTWNGAKIRCIVNYASCTDTSTEAELTVLNCPVLISTQPLSLSIYVTQSANFKSPIADTATKLQWQINQGSGFTNLLDNTTFKGSVTDSLQIIQASKSLHHSEFRLIARKQTCADTSQIATLSVISCPSLIDSTSGKTQKYVADNTTLHTHSNDQNLTYQWQVKQMNTFSNISNSGKYSGTNTASLTINNLTLAENNREFRCIVSKTGTPCVDTSTGFILKISSCPKLISNNLINFSGYVNDPLSRESILNISEASSQWQINSGSGFVNMQNQGFVTGTNTTNLEISALSLDYNNTLIRNIAKFESCSDTSNSALILVRECSPWIIKQPIDTAVLISENTFFEIEDTESGLDYVWQLKIGSVFENLEDNSKYNGTNTAKLSILNITETDFGNEYRCIVSKGSCVDTSSSAKLSKKETINIKKIQLSEHYRIFPNPANISLQVVMLSNNSKAVEYSIVDQIGRKMIQGKQPFNSDNFTIDIKDLNSGIYYLEIDNQTLIFIKE
jgi:hypothetical protein